jgi:hypothetical protein
MSFSEDLSDIVTVSAEVHAEELRVDESRSRTRQGVSEVERTGIEPSGAIPGRTYRDIEIKYRLTGTGCITTPLRNHGQHVPTDA